MTTASLKPRLQGRGKPRGGWARRRWGWMGLALLLVLLAACAAGSRGNPFDRSQNTDHVVLRVENQNLYEASIYLSPGGQRSLLGKVESRSVQFFEFRWPAVTPLELEIELTAGERYRPPPFQFAPGLQVELIVAMQLRRSVLRQ